jgi:two-component system, chemotaxis family, chemotaxis protein CheY
MSKRVLIVDDSLYMRTVIKETLSGAGYEVIAQAANGEEAIDLATEMKPDLITLDNILPDMLGLDIIKTLRDEKSSAKIIMISAVSQKSVIDTGMSLGADAYLVKPFTPEQLLETASKLLA